MELAELDREEVWKAFGEAVNMAPGALEDWLATEESRSVGWKDTDGGELVGHEFGQADRRYPQEEESRARR